MRIDIDEGQLQRRWPAADALHGDAAATLAALRAALPRAAPAVRRRGTDAAAARARRRSPACGRRRSWRASRRCSTVLDRALPRDRIVAGDSTQPVYAANHLLPMHEPRSWLMPIGYGCLGCALPMALGAKLAAPARPVLAIAGDGGFLFTVAELATARRARARGAAARLQQPRLRRDPRLDGRAGDAAPRHRRVGAGHRRGRARLRLRVASRTSSLDELEPLLAARSRPAGRP